MRSVDGSYVLYQLYIHGWSESTFKQEKLKTEQKNRLQTCRDGCLGHELLAKLAFTFAVDQRSFSNWNALEVEKIEEIQ